MLEKYIKEGMVAVLISPGYGAGWSTFNEPAIAFDKRLVEAFIEGGVNKCLEAVSEFYPGTYTGGAGSLTIEWVRVGTMFRINAYDGAEHIEIFDPSAFFVA